MSPPQKLLHRVGDFFTPTILSDMISKIVTFAWSNSSLSMATIKTLRIRRHHTTVLFHSLVSALLTREQDGEVEFVCVYPSKYTTMYFCMREFTRPSSTFNDNAHKQNNRV